MSQMCINSGKLYVAQLLLHEKQLCVTLRHSPRPAHIVCTTFKVARASTLPDCLYQKKIQVGEKKSLPLAANGSGTEDTQHQDEQDSTVEDEVTEFD